MKIFAIILVFLSMVQAQKEGAAKNGKVFGGNYRIKRADANSELCETHPEYCIG